METRGLVECPNCGHRVFELFKLTAEDIQRVHSPEEMGIYWGVCWDCREKFRSAARLEVDYATSRALRDVVLFTLFFSVTLFLLKLLVPSATILMYGLAFFTGIMYLFRRSSGRYAFTHNLAWSMKNMNAMIGFSLIVASILIALVPF
jgi:uncharacterized membrane protein